MISQSFGGTFINACVFGTTDPIYLDYHGKVWGQPDFNSLLLFKLLVLESQHAGLSRLIILKKKEAYEKAFHQSDPIKISKMTEKDINVLMTFPNIVHNREKLEAIASQAKGYLQIEKEYGSFSKFLWSYVDGHPIDLHYKIPSKRITVDERAKQLSEDLKAYGFKFLGSVTVFSFMEAAGLYDAHLEGYPLEPNY